MKIKEPSVIWRCTGAINFETLVKIWCLKVRATPRKQEKMNFKSTIFFGLSKNEFYMHPVHVKVREK